MKKYRILSIALFVLLPSLLPAQPLTTVSVDGSLGDFRNAASEISTQIPFGESGWSTTLKARYVYENYKDLSWMDGNVRDEMEDIYRFEGETLLNGNIGKYYTTLSVKGGLTGTGAGFDESGDPCFSSYGGVMFPVGRRVRIMPVISYAFGGAYPIPTAIVFWNITDRLLLDAKLISPRLNLTYAFNETQLVRGGFEFDQENVDLDGKREFFYRRLVSRLEYRHSFHPRFALTAYGEGAFLHSSEFEDPDVKIKDDSDGVDLRIGLRVTASF
jgi:hypothetical protein